jgi:hypothetical protein
MRPTSSPPMYDTTVDEVLARFMDEATAYATRELLARNPHANPAPVGLPLVVPMDEWQTFSRQRTQWVAQAVAELRRNLAAALQVTPDDLDAAVLSPEPARTVPDKDWRPADA